MNKLGMCQYKNSTDYSLQELSWIPLEAGPSGEARSIIDFAPLPNTAPTLTSRTEIKLQSSTETSKKGVVRILLKVNLPYSGLYPSDIATGESNLKFSPNRSVGSVSAHIVLTLPKECVQDLVQQKAGSTGRRCALAHIQTVLGILDTIKLAGNGTSVAAPQAEGFAYFTSDSVDGLALVGLDTTSGTPKISAPEVELTNMTSLIDRACRGYTPLSDVEQVGLAAIL